MAPGEIGIIGPESLEKAIRSVALHTRCDEIVVIGSQALLVGRNDVPRDLRFSREIDLYPIQDNGNADKSTEMSEEINALFGEGSEFDQSFGFFIDGTDEATAKLSPSWRDRAVRRNYEIESRVVTAIAPEPNDLVASKLVRGEPKDVKFATGCFRSGFIKFDMVKHRLSEILSEADLTLALQRLNRARHPKPFNQNLSHGGFER